MRCVVQVRGGVVDDAFGGVTDYVFDDAEGVPVEKGGVKGEKFGEVVEHGLVIGMCGDPFGYGLRVEHIRGVGFASVGGDCNVVRWFLRIKEVADGVGENAVVMVFVGLDVGEDAVVK